MDTTNLEFSKATALLEQASGYRGPVPRNINLVVDWANREIYAETRNPDDRAVSEARWNGLEDAYPLPQGVDASKLREWAEQEVVPRAQPLADAFGVVYDGSRRVGRFPGDNEDKKYHFDEWMALFAEPPQHSGGLWSVEDWLEGCVDEVRPDSSDEDLVVLANEIVEEADEANVVLVGGIGEVFDYLRTLRDSLRGPDLYEIEGYEVVEKTARATGTSARVWVPRAWAGKRVKIVRLDP